MATPVHTDNPHADNAPSLIERKQCPSCGAGDYTVLLKIPYAELDTFLKTYYHRPPDTTPLAGWNYELARCKGCALVYQRYVPGPSLLQSLYDEWISPSPPERARGTRTLDDYRTMAEEVQFFIEHLRMRPASINVLDFGLGWGHWASMAQAFGCNVYGAELSVERQRYAQSIGIQIVDGNALPERRFHFINTEQVFEHLADPAAIVRQLARALADNGILRINVPNARSAIREVEKTRSFTALSKLQIMAIQPLEHLNSFEPETLERLGRNAGLEPIRPSLRLLYNSSSGWFRPRAALKSLLRPVYRHVFRRNTIVYFRKAPTRPGA